MSLRKVAGDEPIREQGETCVRSRQHDEGRGRRRSYRSVDVDGRFLAVTYEAPRAATPIRERGEAGVTFQFGRPFRGPVLPQICRRADHDAADGRQRMSDVRGAARRRNAGAHGDVDSVSHEVDGLILHVKIDA